MNSEKLREYMQANKELFRQLAECGSVAEMMVRLTAYGKVWGRLSWALFIQFLWTTIHASNTLGRQPGSSFKQCAAATMMADIIKTIDEDTMLDSVVTNKTVVLSMLQISGLVEAGDIDGLMCVLAHAFSKFPSMWNMNWMYIRRKGARVHRMAWTVAMPNRPPEYFASKAFLDDFVHRYWNPYAG